MDDHPALPPPPPSPDPALAHRIATFARAAAAAGPGLVRQVADQHKVYEREKRERERGQRRVVGGLSSSHARPSSIPSILARPPPTPTLPPRSGRPRLCLPGRRPGRGRLGGRPA